MHGSRVVLFVSLTILVALAGFQYGLHLVDEDSGPTEPGWQEGQERRQEPRPLSATIAAVGDVMVHSPQIWAARQDDGTYDFTPVFRPVKDYIQSADIAVANLETTMAGKDEGYSGYPTFNSPAQLGQALRETGFDLVFTANNHALDRGGKGALATIENLHEAGLQHVGTSSTREERETVLARNVNGIEVAFLAYTYGTNGIPVPDDKPYLVNMIDEEQMKEDLRRARREGADLIVVSLHCGQEYKRQPSARQRELTDLLIKNGADIVLGTHPHVLQPVEFKRVQVGENVYRRGLVAYSLGNFVSNQRRGYTDSGVILLIEVEKNIEFGTVRLKEVRYIPTWVHKSHVEGQLQYRVLAVKDAVRDCQEKESPRFSGRDCTRLKQVWEETTSLFENLPR